MKMIDPPEGWKYNFPKACPKEFCHTQILAWLVDEGYPERLIESYGDQFYYSIANLPPKKIPINPNQFVAILKS